jgi:hypothetical protein
VSCFESKERLPPTHKKKKRKKKYLSRLRRDNRKGPPHIKVDRSTSSNNARDFDDFDFDAEEEEEEEETRKKKKRDRSVFLSFQQKRFGDQSRSFLLLLRGGFFAPFLNTPPKQPLGEREYLLR